MSAIHYFLRSVYLIVIIFSSSWLLYFLLYVLSIDRYYLLYFGDAVSHLIIARKVLDWANPGIQQLGTVWLPMLHILLIPFTSIDQIFRTGLAGAFINLPFTVLTCLLLYRIVIILTNSKVAGFLSSIVYIVNPNVTYMGLIAMSESLSNFFITLTAYFTLRYVKNGNHKLGHQVKASIASVFATLTRYESWPIPLFILIISIVENKRRCLKKLVKSIMISMLSFVGIMFWFIWNHVFYSDPLAFVTIEYYSAGWQASNRPFRELLYLNPINVLTNLTLASIDFYGFTYLLLAILGIIILAINFKNSKVIIYTLIMLIIPTSTTFIAMIGGHAELINVYGDHWFNARFLTLLAPFLALCSSAVTLILKSRKVFLSFLVIAVALVPLVEDPFETRSPVVIKDAYIGFSSKQNESNLAVANELSNLYSDGEILILTGSAQAHRIMLLSNIQLKSFVDPVGNNLFNNFKEIPLGFFKFIVIAKKPDPDVESLAIYWIKNIDTLLKGYDIVYEDDYYIILKNKDDN